MKLDAAVPPGCDRAERLRLAQQLCDLCLHKHGDHIAVIGIYGSTAVGSDGPYSDLDMTIVHRADLDAETKCYNLDGMPINLDYQTIKDSMEEAKDPAEGGYWIDFLVLYDPENLVETLRQTYRRLTPADYLKRLERKTQDELATFIGKMRNAALAEDRAQFTRASQDFGEEICRALLLINQTHSTGRSRLLNHAKNLAVKPERFDERIDIVLGVHPEPDEHIYASAETLWQQMREMVVERGGKVSCEKLVP